jgi:2-polyprenyl-3-methyl-5-hydroxy-6-metoxy-1,4-benzoquinol methylase
MVPEGGTVAPENPVWVKFARAMVPMITGPAQAMAKLVNQDGGGLKVLDIAAGHGMFGITIARQNPKAEIVALDWPNVLEVAQENASQAGVSDRYSTIAGSAFDVDYGTGYDLVLLTNFLHHFDPQTNETLLRKVHAALAQGGRALALEFVPNEDRVSPRIPAAFSMMMLGSTPSGDAYTFRELERMFKAAGFANVELHQLPATPEQLVVASK